MEWAEQHEGEIKKEDLELQSETGVEISHILYHQLVINMSGDGIEIVKNTVDENGIEAWRKICKRFAPNNPTRALQLMLEVIQPTRPKANEEVERCIDKWETTLRRLQKEYKEVLSEKMKVAVALDFCPPELRENLLRNAEVINGYQELKDKITSYVSIQQSRLKPNPDDINSWDEYYNEEMNDEIDMLGKGGSRCHRCGGGGHIAAQCASQRMTCNRCGGNGHMSYQCATPKGQGKGWEKGGDKGKGGGKLGVGGKVGGGKVGGGKGKEGKKGGHISEFQGFCNHCGQWGHKAMFCLGGRGGYKGGGKGVAEVEEYNPESEIDTNQLVSVEWSLGGDMNYLEMDPVSVSTSSSESIAGQPSIIDDTIAKIQVWKEARTQKKRKSMDNPMKVNIDGFQKSHSKHGHIHHKFVVPSRFSVLNMDYDTDNESHHVTEHDNSNGSMDEEETIEEESIDGGFIAAVDQNEPGRKFKSSLTIDSGAAEHVIPTQFVPPGMVQPSEAQRTGVTYRAANGAKLANRGQRKVTILTKENLKPSMTFQITDVKKALASVARICDSGNRVVLEAGGGYIENVHNGDRIGITRENNTYALACEMLMVGEGFQRQGI